MAAFGEPQLAGLAGEIRAMIESEQFDLANYTEQRAKDLINAAFSAPLLGPTKMIKITFVVGGGKLVRAKYSDDLPKWMIAALKEVGYSDDRSAAETFDSQGTFKQQHDTGQNLKYLIVYPHVACANAAAMGDGADANSAPAIDESSPEYIVCASEIGTFRDIVSSKVASYQQKVALMKILQRKAEEFSTLEAKLCSGVMLSPSEQAVYDANSGSDAEKITWLQGEMKQMLERGHLSKEEKDDLLKTIAENMAHMREELAAAEKEGKAKKVEKLTEKLQKLTARKGTVEAVEPKQLRLRHGDKIQALHMKVFPLNGLEDKSRSMGLTLADLRVLEQKPDLLAEIHSLENSSRGWFEEDATFEAKCAFEEKQAQAAYNKRISGKKSSSSSGGGGGGKGGSTQGRTGGGGSSSATTWATVGKQTGGGVKTSRTAAAKKNNLGGSFAAAFGSDSDSD